ncbi:hypothetical protein [Chitinophaga sp.]|uniref:hypothetical protein n=1 Tax=Chitinophaga sp. TaxID=1869181 RepID=UPI002626497A|nr:hypothetical protein [uncultured Chitinophaga sp.]
MRNRIRNILVLMTACILGILALQGYWLYESYKIRLQEFDRDINDALRTAVFHKQFGDAGKVLGLAKFNLTYTTTFSDSAPAVPAQPHVQVLHLEDSAELAAPGAVLRKSIFLSAPGQPAAMAGEVVEANGDEIRFRRVQRDTNIRQLTDTLSRQISDILVRRDFYRTALSWTAFTAGNWGPGGSVPLIASIQWWRGRKSCNPTGKRPSTPTSSPSTRPITFSCPPVSTVPCRTSWAA